LCEEAKNYKLKVKGNVHLKTDGKLKERKKERRKERKKERKKERTMKR